jgi:hypothetical protein
MFTNIFYHGTIRKAILAFGTIFNDISVVRRDKFGREIERIKVPAKYGPTESYLIKTNKNPDFNDSVVIEFPRIGYQTTSFTYDGSRKLNTMHKNRKSIENDGSHVNSQYNPVSYKIGMELYIISKYGDDGNQIVEQILPWFTPDYTVTIKAIPELNLIDDVPITITGVAANDNFEDDWITRRDVVWTLNFEMKVLFYGPIRVKNVITKVQTDFLVPPPGSSVHTQQVRDETPRAGRIITEILPGSTYEENFGATTNFFEFDDNKKFNPVTGLDEDVLLKIKSTGIQSKEKFGIIKIGNV